MRKLNPSPSLKCFHFGLFARKQTFVLYKVVLKVQTSSFFKWTCFIGLVTFQPKCFCSDFTPKKTSKTCGSTKLMISCRLVFLDWKLDAISCTEWNNYCVQVKGMRLHHSTGEVPDDLCSKSFLSF